MHVCQLVIQLVEDLARAGTAAVKITLPGVQQGPFRSQDLSRAVGQGIRDGKLIGPVHFCFQAELFDFQGVDLVLQFIGDGAEFGVLQLGQDLPGAHLVPLAHVELGQNAAFEVLYDLRPRGGDHFAFTAHDLIHRCKGRPAEEQHQSRPDQIDNAAGATGAFGKIVMRG